MTQKPLRKASVKPSHRKKGDQSILIPVNEQNVLTTKRCKAWVSHTVVFWALLLMCPWEYLAEQGHQTLRLL